MRTLRHIILLLAALIAVPALSVGADAATPKKKTTRSTSKSSSGRKNSKKKAKETSKDVKRKEAITQQEIKATEAKIEANDKEVAANLSLLSELDISIKNSQNRIADLSGQVKGIDTQIDGLSGKIAAEEQHIATLRAKYVDAVKKMRVARKQTSFLGFIFSSKNFYQAYRRMRYLRKFSQWRRRQVAEIRGEIQRLNASKAQLAQMRVTKDHTLAEQQKAQTKLSDQQAQQRATVAKLRADGEALRSHLARKQSEANQLQSRMTELIAAEQAAAAEAKRRREEQQRLEAERKAKAEREAQERRVAEEKRLAEEQKAREKREAEEAARKKETAQKEQSSKKETTKKETKKKETPKQNSGKSRDNRSYAEARGRSARGSGSAPAKSQTPAKTQTSTSTSAASASGFASMKGKLPRPVAGSFSVINAFGRHPLPDLPDVMYDNPGIDALVKKGEKAKAVYDGTVSGVYMINGFSNVVLVSHGDYFTVYGNIASPSVSKGQSVKQGQALGTLATDPDDGNRTTIHFEVWKGRTKLNPAEWIR